jgi:polyadenylate-binding protein
MNQSNQSLYVGDLAPDVTEALLHDVFKKVGAILSIRVCRDSATKQSLGYAYVNFVQATDAERARETLNYHPIHGRPIRIMWCQKDPNMRKQGKGNVIIKNLHKSIDNPTLYDTFSQFGNILSCKVEHDRESGESKGYGFVHFESEDAAKQAIAKVDGMMLAGQLVAVQAFIPRAERIEHNKATFTNLEVKGFKEEVEEEAIKEHFEKYGEVKRVKLLRDRKNLPFAFIDYETHEAATKAIEECNGKCVPEICEESATMSLQRSLTKAERKDQIQKQKHSRFAQQAENSVGGLYVGNLADDVDDAELREAFSKFGELVRAQVMKTQTAVRKSRGFGFVCFTNAAAADNAQREMNNSELQGRRIVVNRAQHRNRMNAPQHNAMPGGGHWQSPQAPSFPGYPMGSPAPMPLAQAVAPWYSGTPYSYTMYGAAPQYSYTGGPQFSMQGPRGLNM